MSCNHAVLKISSQVFRGFEFLASIILLKPSFLPPSILFFLSLHPILLLSLFLSSPQPVTPSPHSSIAPSSLHLSASFFPFISVSIPHLLSLLCPSPCLSLPFHIHGSFNLFLCFLSHLLVFHLFSCQKLMTRSSSLRLADTHTITHKHTNTRHIKHNWVYTLAHLPTQTHIQWVTLCQRLFSAERLWAAWWCRVTVAIFCCRGDAFTTANCGIQAQTHKLTTAGLERGDVKNNMPTCSQLHTHPDIEAFDHTCMDSHINTVHQVELPYFNKDTLTLLGFN